MLEVARERYPDYTIEEIARAFSTELKMHETWLQGIEDLKSLVALLRAMNDKNDDVD
jgi:hypothetical protein